MPFEPIALACQFVSIAYSTVENSTEFVVEKTFLYGVFLLLYTHTHTRTHAHAHTHTRALQVGTTAEVVGMREGPVDTQYWGPHLIVKFLGRQRFKLIEILRRANG